MSSETLTIEEFQEIGKALRFLLMVAWLLPLAGFAVEIFAGYWGHRRSKMASFLAVGCIFIGFACSLGALIHWGTLTRWGHKTVAESQHHEGKSEGEGQTGILDAGKLPVEFVALADKPTAHKDADNDDHHTTSGGGHKDAHHEGEHHDDHHGPGTPAFSGGFYLLGSFGDIEIGLDYYIDSLTLIMFTMVTLIATCIHIFAIGYMSDELVEDYVDHHAHTSDGKHVHRPGRFYRFFAFMSLFCFSMLGLVLAGNIFQVFVFWELVGICSYLLIGFYTERKSASTAANKAFIMNRVGDFGFLIGLMVIVTYLGTFRFADHEVNGAAQPGLFTMIRGADGHIDLDQTVDVETGNDVNVVLLKGVDGETLTNANGKNRTIPYWLLIVAGLGVFGGCVGKSAQFPLQTWLPDAMEGPTPVSALVHSATMVAAGVYLAGRFFPMFTTEVLLTIAYIGCITLFVAATIAVVATDIKRVLAYSTISQLGYMMLAIGIGGWGAGLFHLVTHAFFKSLMFLASGSVIIGCHHEQEMPRMGGLWRKMPITAFTMLVGVIAISGLAIPGISIFGEKIAFSGYHSKDEIVATALAFMQMNEQHFLLFLVPLITAGITAFYMFRLWFYTFAGEPRDAELHSHVHETPWVMTTPLIILAVFAAGCAIGGTHGPLWLGLLNSEPIGLATGLTGQLSGIATPSHDAVHAVHSTAGMYALIVAATGAFVAYLLYGAGVIDPGDIKQQFVSLHTFLVEKWRFDELYDAMFVRPVHIVASWCVGVDRYVFDGLIHRTARTTIDVSRWDRKFDEGIIDGLVNLVGNAVFSAGRSLRVVQTGSLRQYIMFIAVGVLVLFVLLFAVFPS